MAQTRSTLLVYNTVDRLLRGDLFHTVTAQDVLHDLGRFDAALESYNRAAEIDPDFVEARRNAFWIHLGNLKDPDMVARSSQEAVRTVIKRECDALSAQRAIA